MQMDINIYYVSLLLRTLWLASLAGHMLPYSLLKLEAVFIAKLSDDLSSGLLNFHDNC